MTRPRPAVLLAACAVTAALALAASGVLPWPRCPFHEYLGVDCPMCGTTRAGLALLAGDYAGAFRENPAWWLWLFWTLAAFADLWHRAWRAHGTVGQRLAARVAASPALSGGHAAAALLLFAYRNLLR